MNSKPLVMHGDSLTLAEVATFLAEGGTVELAPSAAARCQASRAVVDAAVAAGAVVYGITTGFGKLSSVHIPASDLRQLQVNLVLSHAAGVGEPLPPDVARLVLLLKANNLARGLSGVRLEVVEALIALLNTGAIPVIPSQGSVGASGDLAPLAHLTLILLGHPAGAVDWQGARWSADRFLPAAGLTPLELEAKEGLSLLNGTQVSCALGVVALLQGEGLADAADRCCALSVEAFAGSRTPFDPRIAQARGQAGQQQVAETIWRLLAGSPILESHADCGKVQDPYAFRCASQVHGAARDTLVFARQLLERELNAVTDNPLVFAESGDILSGGNFHAEPCGFASDAIAVALTELASISERRVAQLIDPSASGLPAFLVAGSGLHSGFMIAQVTAAALVSEMKTLSHPGVVDSIPTSANKEDHVSMATWSGRKALMVAERCQQVLAIELLAAAQGIDLRRPLRTTPPLEAIHRQVRARVDPWDADRVMATDIAAIAPLIVTGLLASD